MKCAGKKFRRRQTRRVLALVPLLFLILVACGNSADYSGEYTANYDMKEQLNSDLQASGLPIQIEGSVEASYHLTLREDGTFSLTLNTETFGENLKTALLDEQDAIVSALLEAEGVTEDMYEILVQAGGYESFAEFQSEIMEEAVGALEDEAMEDLKEASTQEGTYEIKGNAVLFTNENTSAEQLAEGTIESDGTIHIAAADIAGAGEFVFVKSSSSK